MRAASFFYLALLVSSLRVEGTQLFWSGDGTTFGGAGTWDTVTAHWGTSTSGPFTIVWNNAAADDATIDNGTGAGGSIVINSPITFAGTLTLNTACGTCPAYTIDGTGTMTFTPGSAISAPVNVNMMRSINVRYAGIITKIGAGLVAFNNANGNVTKFILKQGTANFSSTNRFGTGPDSADFLTFDGGTLRMDTVTTWIMGRSITLTANSGTMTKMSSTTTMTLDKAIHGTAGGKLSLQPGGSGGITIISSTANDWNGGLDIGGTTTVQCGAAGVIPNTCVVTLLASGANLQLNGFDQTVKSISGTGGAFACGARTLTINAPNGETYSSVFTASAGGKVIKNGAGMLTLSGNSTGFGGEFIVNDGMIGYGSSGALGASATAGIITLNGGKLSNTGTSGRSVAATVSVNLVGDFTVDDSLFGPNPGQILFNGTSTIKNANRIITVSGGANLGLGPVTQDIAGRSITKAGNGILTFTAANTYADTTVSEGTLVVTGSGSLGSSATATNTIAAGATLDVTGRTGGSLTIGPGQTLAGSGTVLGAIVLNGTISPGGSPGTLSTGSETWNGGGHYAWQINNATNAAGADPGWDLINISGGLNLAAAAANKFTIDISSLAPANTNGAADGFDNTSDYVWTIVHTTQGITNFDANTFALSRSGFSNDLGGGTFSLALANSGKDLQLVFASNNRSYSISNISVSGSIVTLGWESVSGTKYQVKGSTDLTQPFASWTNVGGVVIASGSSASQTDIPGPTQTFYCVQVVP